MKRSEAASPGVSLFPFLAILLCTMGALIVILVVINRQVQRQANARDADSVAARRTMELDHEELELQVKQLTAARQSTLEELDKARKHLSGLEDQSRQLNDKLSRLKDAAKLLANDKRLQQREAMRAELAKLSARRKELDEEIAKAQQAASEKPSFAIIPYDGLYHTNRRPIYIECRDDTVILQPEGIVFTREDFLGPPGPGNPLASALRAAREYWSTIPPPAPGIPTEPYPLLLVRPNGVMGYYLARDAMASWASEFGYELIDHDWKLEYPATPDPQLVQMETRAVGEARDRLKWLAKVSPELFAHKSKTQYRMSAISGGLVRDGGPSLGNDPFADDPLGGFGIKKSPAGDPSGVGPRYAAVSATGQGSGTGAGPFNGTGNSAIPGYGTGSGNSLTGNLTGSGISPGNSPGANQLGSGQPGQQGGAFAGGGSHASGSQFGGDGAGGGLGSESTNTLAGAGRYGLSGTGGGGNALSPANGSGLGNAANGSRANGPSGATDAGTNTTAYRGGATSDLYGLAGGSSDSLSNGTSSSSQYGSSANSFASMGTPGGQSGTGGYSGQAGGSAAQAGSAMGQAGSSMGQPGGDPSTMSGMPSPSLNFHAPQRTASRSIADTRGRNWALPNRESASVPITRPIRVECRADRLVIVPDVRDQQAQVIPLTDRTGETVDRFIAAIRTHTQSWGMAGRGMYWKPQLILDVDPTAEARAADLQVLLADSGLVVKRK